MKTAATQPDLTMEAVNAYSDHSIVGDTLFGSEAKIIAAYVKPTDIVLEIGCGTGRVTRALARTGAKVHACDLDERALEILRESAEIENVEIRTADARRLPFEDGKFDVVLFPFNGLDFLRPLGDRFLTISEMNRVLKPGGHLIVSSHNPIGALLSPRGLRRLAAWKARFSLLVTGKMMDTYAPDASGVILYHGTPARVIAEVESHSKLRFLFCCNRTGGIKSKLLVTLGSAWPAYVFEKKA